MVNLLVSMMVEGSVILRVASWAVMRDDYLVDHLAY